MEAKPITQPRVVDFGKGLGRKSVWLYHLPEVESTHKYMRVPNVSARFGTDPSEYPLTVRSLQNRIVQVLLHVAGLNLWVLAFLILM